MGNHIIGYLTVSDIGKISRSLMTESYANLCVLKHLAKSSKETKEVKLIMNDLLLMGKTKNIAKAIMKTEETLKKRGIIEESDMGRLKVEVEFEKGR